MEDQWKREIAKFSGREATIIGGLRATRQTLYKQADFCKITNYEAIVRVPDLIQDWAPDLVIVDEAQRIKNWNTHAARALKRIKSPYAVVMTGTPLGATAGSRPATVGWPIRRKRPSASG